MSYLELKFSLFTQFEQWRVWNQNPSIQDWIFLNIKIDFMCNYSLYEILGAKKSDKWTWKVEPHRKVLSNCRSRTNKLGVLLRLHEGGKKPATSTPHFVPVDLTEICIEKFGWDSSLRFTRLSSFFPFFNPSNSFHTNVDVNLS